MAKPGSRSKPVKVMPVSESWMNRIVGEGVERAAQLLANLRNWRIHPAAQQEALGRVLESMGWVQRIIVNRRTGNVVDGHLRVHLALAKGEDEAVPVTYIDVSEEEEALLLAALDPLSAMAVMDAEKVDGLLKEIAETGGKEMLKDVWPEWKFEPSAIPELPEFQPEQEQAGSTGTIARSVTFDVRQWEIVTSAWDERGGKRSLAAFIIDAVTTTGA
jgi:hypothetical protein